MNNVKVSKTAEIKVDGWVGFKVVVPNGTSIYLVNQFLGEALDGTAKIINQKNRSKNSASDKISKPVFFFKMFS